MGADIRPESVGSPDVVRGNRLGAVLLMAGVLMIGAFWYAYGVERRKQDPINDEWETFIKDLQERHAEKIAEITLRKWFEQ